MKIYSHFGIHDFVICAGYKGYMIKEYFSNYFLHMSDVTFDLTANKFEIHHQRTEPWRVTVVDTGNDTLTGGRLMRIRQHVESETFCLTYGDGVADVDMEKLLQTHKDSSRLATVTAVQPPSRYGALKIDENNCVRRFKEKPKGDGGWINGGFFVVEPEALDLIAGDSVSWEDMVLETLASQGQLTAYRHLDFWQPMDTLRDKILLDELWESGAAPWKIWK